MAFAGRSIRPVIFSLSVSGLSPNKKTGIVHDHILRGILPALVEDIEQLDVSVRPAFAVAAKYACFVASLVARHEIWPYDALSFSRRVGEYWETMCVTAWEYPIADVREVDVPTAAVVKADFLAALRETIADSPKAGEAIGLVDEFTKPMEDIDMRTDLVFEVDGVVHVVDFKSGFGSNEKGNRDRLSGLAFLVGKWKPSARRWLLVRQTENNSYLSTLDTPAGWTVVTGREVYAWIAQMTGVDIQAICTAVVDWEADLPPDFKVFLKGHSPDLWSYLHWHA
jgi:hypothetical protein